MPDEDVAAAGLSQHPGRDFPGERAFFFPEEVLPGDSNPGTACRLNGGRYRGEGWRDNDVAVFGVSYERCKRGEEGARLRLRLIHLPIAGNDAAPHKLLSASTPGSFRPARNSSEAPPPVEMCEIRFATPD